METVKFNFENYKNFDFKKNWISLVKPHLTNERLIKSIERGIIGYIHNKMPWPDSELYEIETFEEYFKTEKAKYVAQYSSYDSFTTCIDELEEQIIEEFNLDIDALFLIKHPQYNGLDCEELEEEVYDDYFQLYIDFREELLKPYLNDKLKDDYKTYCLYGGCFWYNLTFGYTLAKLVYPNYKWEIACSSKHLTVVCHNHKLIFDILYYDIDKYNFGAVDALNDAFLDDEMDYKDITCQYIL